MKIKYLKDIKQNVYLESSLTSNQIKKIRTNLYAVNTEHTKDVLVE